LLAINTDISNKANLNSPEFIGNPIVPTPGENDNSLQIVNVEFV
jgi:hypothetical protein